MKKILICALAVGMFTACSQEETLSTQAPTQISFAGAFVENATRAAVDPSITTANISNFDVWGFMDNTNGKVFTDEKVWKSGSDWAYANTQYWTPKHEYYFAAVAPSDEKNEFIQVNTGNANIYGIGTINFINNDGETDLLYSAVGPITTGDKIDAQPDPVKFQFNHMLSKVKFTFINGYTNSNSTIEITDIQMTAPKSGSIDVAQEDWWSENHWALTAGQENALSLKFGDLESNNLAAGAKLESAKERLTIPADEEQVYTVTFNVKLYQGDVVALEGKKTATITGVALEIGKAYNFTAELNSSNLTDEVTENPLYPITFTVTEVKDWVDAGKQTTILGGTIDKDLTLVADAKATSIVAIAGGKSLDGAGHTLSIDKATDAFFVNNTFRLMQTNGDATIKNLTIDGSNLGYNANNKTYGIRGIYMTGEGKVNLENVVIENVTYTLNTDASKRVLNVVNSTLSGWTSYSSNTGAYFENVTFSGHFKPHGNAYLKNCKFEESSELDFEEFVDGEGKGIRFENCYYGNIKITAENIITECFKGNQFQGKDVDGNDTFGQTGYDTTKDFLAIQ